MLTNLMAARLRLGSVRPAVRSLCLLLLCAAAPLASAASVKVGDVTLQVPEPAGYAQVTPEMDGLLERAQAMTTASNISLAIFISEGDAAAVLTGGPRTSPRYFWIQTAKGAVGQHVSPEVFAQFKQVIRQTQDEMSERLKRDAPELMNKASEALSEQMDANLLIRLGGLVTMPVHHEDANSISSSMISRVEFSAPGAKSTAEVVTGTYATVNVGGTVVFLYVFGDKDDLAWTREQAEKWTKEVVAANTPRLKKP
ncbi:MAG TPA: hypothetical protein VM469_12230 [Pseudoxanthomonas sp.]|nr:hypothetical protein [Pseudoxanthomonas sp.]